jgi:hypothetical protein
MNQLFTANGLVLHMRKTGERIKVTLKGTDIDRKNVTGAYKTIAINDPSVIEEIHQEDLPAYRGAKKILEKHNEEKTLLLFKKYPEIIFDDDALESRRTMLVKLLDSTAAGKPLEGYSIKLNRASNEIIIENENQDRAVFTHRGDGDWDQSISHKNWGKKKFLISPISPHNKDFIEDLAKHLNKD